MRFEQNPSRPSLGIAYAGYVPAFVAKYPDAVDYVEVPFELLHRNAKAIPTPFPRPLILHCASLSIAGEVPPGADIVESVADWIARTGTPWLGEHLAFVTADVADAEFSTRRIAEQVYDIGYSINGPTNDQSLRRVQAMLATYRRRFELPILVENPPVYFTPPGSTMTQTDFIRELCGDSSVRLLLDLTHLQITAAALGLDARAELRRLPLDRVDEVHVSGAWQTGDLLWDDHTRPASSEVLDLLAIVVSSAYPCAVTLEYNWSVRFPIPVLLGEISRVRRVLG